MLKTDATQGTQPRVVFDNPDVAWIAPNDWSPDGKRLAVQLKRLDRTAQIGIVSVQDGAHTPLKSIDWRGASGVLFSPDGSSVRPAAVGFQSERDVYLLRADGTGESVIAQHRADDVQGRLVSGRENTPLHQRPRAPPASGRQFVTGGRQLALLL